MAQAHTAPVELGTESIGKLLKKFAVPGIIAMTASSLYNMVDSIFIGHIPGEGSLALSGLAVSFPLMNLSTALGTLVGVGAATLLSVLLGQKNYQAANKVLANDISLNCITSVNGGSSFMARVRVRTVRVSSLHRLTSRRTCTRWVRGFRMASAPSSRR